jgi:hypothetical protein
LTYYEDKSYYSEQHFENTQNIGWLDSKFEIEKKEYNDQLIDSLLEYVKYPFNMIRSNMIVDLAIKNTSYKLGFSEIRVLGDDGKKYAAPDLIIHYIKENGYQPPLDFVEAVLNGPKPTTEIYQDYLKRYNKSNLWGQDDEYIENSKYIKEKIYGNSRDTVSILEKKQRLKEIITADGSLLNTSIKAKNVEVINYLLESSTKYLDKFSGAELITAINYRQIDTVKKLLDKGIYINYRELKKNPLIKAMDTKDVELVKLLLNSDIQKDVIYNNEFVSNFTIYDYAKEYHPELLALL